MIVRELFARLGVKTDDSSIQKGDQALSKLKLAAAAIGSTLAAAWAGSKLKNIIQETTTAADSIAKMSKRLGVNAQALQELQFAAQLSGASAADLNNGLRTLGRYADEAASGMATYADEFKRLGVDVKGADGKLKPMEQLIVEMGDGFAALTNDTERLAIAQKLLGRGGAAMVPLLKQGSAAMAAMREEARETGGVFSDEFLRASEDVVDQQLRLKMTWLGLKTTIAQKFLPVFNMLLDAIMDGVKWLNKYLEGTQILEIAMGTLAAIAGTVAFVLGVKLLAAVGGLALSMVNLAAAFGTAGTAALLAQLKMIAIGVAFIALAALIALLVEDIIGNFTDMDTAGKRISDMLEDLYEKFQLLGQGSPIIEGILLPFKILLRVLARVKDALFSVYALLIGEDAGGFKKVWEDIKNDVKFVGDSLNRITGGFDNVKKKAAGFIGSVGEALGVTGPKTVPVSAAAGANLSQSVNRGSVSINQTINAAPGQSPEAVGKASTQAMREVVKEDYRKTKTFFTPAREAS